MGFRRKSKADDTKPDGAETGQAEATEVDQTDETDLRPDSAEAVPPEDVPTEDVPAGAVLAEEGPTPVDDAPAWPSAGLSEREGGPWDEAEVPADDKVERVDLGGVRVPIVAEMELRAEIAEDQVVAATLILGRSALQIQPFAAPRTIGIWDEIRAEIAAGIAESGGRANESDGRFGAELVAEVGVTMPDGTTGAQTARFLGVNGPRWFLRAVITGEAAEDSGARQALEDLFADIVVVRGDDAMAPRDPILLRLPEEVELGQPGEAFDADDENAEDEPAGRRADDLKPFERGPEITEIR